MHGNAVKEPRLLTSIQGINLQRVLERLDLELRTVWSQYQALWPGAEHANLLLRSRL